MSTQQATQVPAEFHARDRERIRRRLMRYMEDHRIGTPRLQIRIMDSDPRHRELPLSTLQRFLRGSHRTLDAYVGMCAAFLETVQAPYADSDLGIVLAGFIGGGSETADSAELESYAGFYRRWSYGHGEIRSLELSYPPKGRPNGTLRLDLNDGQSYLAAEEFVPLRGPDSPPGRRELCEGVAVPSSGALYLFLRSPLTRTPKAAFVAIKQRGEPSGQQRTLEGTAYEFDPAALRVPGVGLTTTIRLQCLPAPEIGDDHG